jgi:hypothetical protein
LNRNGAQWTIVEAQNERSVVASANGAPISTHMASPCLSEFEAFLENKLGELAKLPVDLTLNQKKPKKLSKNDAY